MTRILHLILLFLASSLYAGELIWEESFSKGVEKSKAEEKPLLLFFTGSDWSGLGMKMKKEILNSTAFQKKVGHSFVCVEVDFPLHRPFSHEKMEQNAKLKERFHVEEFPTLLILDPQEREISRLYYLPENGEMLADDLARIVKQDKELYDGLSQKGKDGKSLKKLYELAQDLQQAGAQELLLAEGVKAEDPFFLLEKYRILIEEKNKEAVALKEKLIAFGSLQIDFTLALIEYQDLAKSQELKKNPEAVIRPLEEYLAKHKSDDLESIWRIEMMIAETFLEADNWKKALSHAWQARNCSPKEMKDEIASLIIYIEAQQKACTALK